MKRQRMAARDQRLNMVGCRRDRGRTKDEKLALPAATTTARLGFAMPDGVREPSARGGTAQEFD